LDVAVRLASAGLHLDVQVHGAHVGGDERLGLHHVLPTLYLPDVLPQGHRLREVEVLEAGAVVDELQHTLCIVLTTSRVHAVGQGSRRWLASKAVDNRLDRCRLVRLLFELELHRHGASLGGQRVLTSVPGESCLKICSTLIFTSSPPY
ncbi:MAG: hypothetical protein ACK559_34060, partial [bacterium]